MKHLVAAALSEPIRSTVWGCTMHTFRSAITRVLLLSAGFAACTSDQAVDPQDQAQEYVLTPEEAKMDLNSVDPKELDLAQLFGFEIKLKKPSEPNPSILDREWTPIQTTVILYRSIVWLYKHDHVDYDNAVYLVLPVVFANIALQNADDELAVRNLELFVQRPQELVDEGILPAEAAEILTVLAERAIEQLQTRDVTIEVTLGSFTVAIAPTDTTIAVGESVNYSATVTDVTGSIIDDPVLTWASSNPVLLSINGTGTASGHKVGDFQIVVSYNGIAAVATLRVR